MIIDIRTRIWTSLEQFGRETAERLRDRYADRWSHLDGSPAAHEQAMSCVDIACVFGFRSALMNAQVPNELVAEFVARDPQRRVGIAGIDPMLPSARDDLEQAVELGCVGVTISPASQGFHPAHSSAMRIYERCDELGLPVFITHGLPLTPLAMLEFARPAALDEVARSIPSLKLVVGELGHPWIDETIVLISKHPHVYADLSGVASRPWQLYNALLTAASYEVMDKLFFGSGFPLESPAKCIESLYLLNGFSHGTQLPSIPRSQIRGIIERDSLRCLGIECEANNRAGVNSAEHRNTLPDSLAESITTTHGSDTHQSDDEPEDDNGADRG